MTESRNAGHEYPVHQHGKRHTTVIVIGIDPHKPTHTATAVDSTSNRTSARSGSTPPQTADREKTVAHHDRRPLRQTQRDRLRTRVGVFSSRAPVGVLADCGWRYAVSYQRAAIGVVCPKSRVGDARSHRRCVSSTRPSPTRIATPCARGWSCTTTNNAPELRTLLIRTWWSILRSGRGDRMRGSDSIDRISDAGSVENDLSTESSAIDALGPRAPSVRVDCVAPVGDLSVA